jgi:hypothetical protein
MLSTSPLDRNANVPFEATANERPTFSTTGTGEPRDRPATGSKREASRVCLLKNAMYPPSR